MKLHLPKLLRNSVLACITAVAGIATTTVGTATFTGGVVAFALSSQQAQADYVWNGGSGNKTGDDWKNESSWNMVDGTTWNDSGNGPGTTGSEMWDKVVIDGGDEGVVFGSEDSRDIPLEGWAPKYELNNNAKLYANMVKLQPGANNAIFTVRNNSLLDFQMGGGSFQGTSILTVGENSGIIFRMQQPASTAAMNITMESSTGYVKFLAGSNINHTGAITLNPVLGELNSDWGSMDLGITAQNVTLSNLTVNLGSTFDGWTKVDTQITEANYAGFGNCYSIIKNAEGKYILTYAVLQEGSSCIWNGGELSWANDTAFSNKTFSAGSVVQFSESDADVVLQENIEASAVVIDDGVTVSLDGNTHELNITGALRLDGTLVLKSDCLTVAGTVAGDNAELVLDAGAEKQWQLADLPQTGDKACTAKVTVASGSLYLTSSTQTMGDITVEDGAGLRLGGNATVGKIVLNGDGGWTSDGAVVNAALLRNNGQGDFTINAVDLASDSTMQIDTGWIIIRSELSGNVLTKNGTGTIRLDGNVYNSGIVINGGTVRWGGNSSDGGTNALTCGSIVINTGATFQINHSSTNCGNTTIELNGGLLYSDDSSADAGTSFKALKVGASSQIKYHWNGGLSFGALTGEGDIAIVGRNDSGGTSIGAVKDYHGTITSELTRPLTIGAVEQAAGKEMTIATAVTLKDFAKTGEGSLVVTGAATLQGNLAVNYEGSLTLSGAVSVAADSMLSYTGDNEKVMTLGTLNTNVVVDILAVSDSVLASGVNLGIALESDIDSEIEALKSKLTVIGLDDYTLTSKDGLAWLSSSAPIQLDWDKNWGAAGLAGAPSALEATEITSTTALSGNEAYDKDGYVAINATTGGDNVVIYGGASNGEGGAGLTSSEDVWIKATSGKFLGLVGASRAQNWMNTGSGWRLNADTHIEVRGADTEVGHIIGGYHQECNSPVFNGSSYISVFEGKVTGNIAGSSATVDGDNYTSYHTGNTNVFIYVPLGTDTTAPDMSNAADPKHVVVGGGISLVHGQTGRVARFEMTGDTNVTIDLSEYSGDATTFDKAVYGGNYTNRTNTGCISKIVGNTNVTIKGGNIEFTGDIVGGSLIQRGDATISGTASTTITGGTFSGNVVAGSFAVDGSTGGDTAQVGSTELTISGGTFNGNVYGGTYMYSGGVTVDVDSVDVNISGGTVTNLVGGNMIGGTGTAAVDAGLGDVDITVSGGEVAKLVGGSIVWRNNAGAVVNQGDITISLNGGTVGDVYAAGSQQGSTTISTASTKVVLGKDVTVNAGATISGGYTAAEGQSGSVVTGKSTLVFSGSGAMDRSGLNFTDFNTVEVTAADANATIGTLTTTSAVEKTGAGTLTLAGGSYALSGGLTVSEGMLATSTATTLGGALTLGDGSSLDVAQGALTLAGEAGAELTLGTNLVLNTTVLGMGDNVIISGVSSVTDLTGQVAAGSFFSSINGITALDDFFIKLDGTNLILVNDSVHDLTWDSANSEWKVGSAFGTNEDGDAANWASENVAIFGNLGDTPVTEEITVVGTGADAVAPLSVTIDAGEGNTYSFSGATISTPDLEVLSGTAKFGSGTLDMNSLQVIVVDGVLDLSSMSSIESDGTGMITKLAEVATGDGTVILAASQYTSLEVDTLRFDVNVQAGDMLKIDRAGDDELVFNVGKSLILNHAGLSGWGQGKLELGAGVNMIVEDGGLVDVNAEINLGCEKTGRADATITIQQGGTVKADRIISNGEWGKYISVEGGVLELTGTGGIASSISTTVNGGTLKAGDNSWGVTGATIGGASIVTGTGTITLTDATLTSTLDNSAGKLGLAGTINITSEGYVTTETPSEYSETGNEGYVRVNTNYVVANTADTNLSIADGTTWTVDGSAANVSYANGVVTVAGTDWSRDFYVRTDKDLSGIAKTNGEGEALATIVLTGGGLNMNEALGEGVTIRIEKEGQSVVNIGDGLTLAAGLVTGTDATHKLELKGNGTYALADGTATLGNAVLGDWTGTVKVTNAYQNDGKMDIDAKLNPLADADSTVEVTNVKGYLDTGKALTANVRLVNATDGTAAITITNGNSDGTAGARKAVIQGTVSGSGDIAFATWDGINGKYVTYEFTGEISGWNGSFINKSPQSYSGTANVVIAGDSVINASFLNDAERYEGSKLYLTIAGENDVTMNGAVDVDKLTVSQNTSFTKTVAVADLVNTASASFANDLALSTLDNTGSITATGKTISVIGATTGAGSITAGALTLQAASNTVGDLTLTGALTLGTADAASTLNAGLLSIGGDVVVNKLTEGLITSTGLAGGSSLNLAITEEVLLDYMLTNVTNTLALGQIDGVTLDQLSLNGIGSSIETEDGQYTYTLSVDGGSITLNRTINGQEWEGTAADNKWGVAGNWSAGTTPDEDASVKFTGSGCSQVVIAGTVKIGNVTIDIEEGTETDSYEFLASTDESITEPNQLSIGKNLSVNAGTLTIGVSTVVEGRSEVLEGSTLNVIASDLSSRLGFNNAGTLNIGAAAGENQTVMYVAGGDFTNSGTIINGGTLIFGNPSPDIDPDAPSMVNSGTINNAGIMGVAGDLNNTGILNQAGVQLGVMGNLSNTGENAKMSISSGETTITGALENSALLEVTAGTVSAGSATNGGTMNVNGGELTIGAEGAGSEVTSMVNSGTLAVTGGSVDINGSMSNSGEGAELTISGEGTSVNITGALTNADSVIVSDGTSLSAGSAANTGSIEVTGGTLVLGDTTTAADVTTLDNDGSLTVNGGTATIYGSVDNDGSLAVVDSTVTITGDLNNTNGTITVGSDTTTGTLLEVGGDLTGTGGTDKLVVNSGSTLDVRGDLTALEDVELDFDGTVIVGGNVKIDSLVNNGVFKTTNTADEATVEIGALSGSGELNVAGGKLLVDSQVDFTGILTGYGELEITGDNGFTLLTKQDAITDTALATDVTASEVTIAEAANGSILSDVTTDSIVIDKLDTELGSEHLTVNSLTSKTADAVINIEIGDLAVDELIANRGKQYDLIALGGAAPDMNLVNNDDVTTADMQKLLANGLNIDLLPGEVNPGVATLAADTMVQLGVRELTLPEATWTVGDSTTGAGLIVLNDNGELKNADILDYVRKVEVAGDQTIDLTNVDTAADNAVQINGLTGTGDLTVQGTADDYVAINNTVIEDAEDPEGSASVSDYSGTLALKDVNAGLDLEDVTVDATTADTTITGSIEGGSLTVYQDSTAQVGDTGLALTDTTLNVVIEKDFVAADGVIKIDQTTLAELENAIADLGGAVDASNVEVKVGTLSDGVLIESLGYGKYFDLNTLRIESDGVVLADRNTSYYSKALTDAATSENGAAGLALADAALLNLNPQGDAVTGNLAAVLDQLDRMVAAGNAAGADELGANLAGASTAVLGMAAQGDVDRQLRAIRNRTTTMGVDQSVVNHDMPYFNAWINAEGDQREMSDDGTLGGYKLNSWGGTVGFDVDIDPTFTAGLALTAMYGDLDATGADKATGNMDTTYVSAFARYCDSAWTHTFVATAGMGDISLDRTVLGNKLKGETESMSFGLMYEVGRVFALDEDATACIQPVFNVTWRHTSVDGYTEKGSDAALEVGEQTLDTITFGLGARVQAVVGESMYNRTSIFECRLLAKADVGDREGTADVALAGGKADVKSAETGAYGLEAGAGLTIPMGDEGSSIFMDASVELRADYTEVNGTVGYRINF